MKYLVGVLLACCAARASCLRLDPLGRRAALDSVARSSVAALALTASTPQPARAIFGLFEGEESDESKAKKAKEQAEAEQRVADLRTLYQVGSDHRGQ